MRVSSWMSACENYIGEIKGRNRERKEMRAWKRKYSMHAVACKAATASELGLRRHHRSLKSRQRAKKKKKTYWPGPVYLAGVDASRPAFKNRRCVVVRGTEAIF